MLFNKCKEQNEWQTALYNLKISNSNIYLIILKMFFHRLNENKIKIAFKIVFDTLISIKSTRDLEDVYFT